MDNQNMYVQNYNIITKILTTATNKLCGQTLMVKKHEMYLKIAFTANGFSEFQIGSPF